MTYSKKFISATKEYSTYSKKIPAPYIRKSFDIDFKVDNSEILICGLGFYEFWLNGEKLTKSCLAPYISAPNDLLYYDRYDLTNKLKKGKNTIAFILGNGLQNCLGGAVWGFDKSEWRSAPKLAVSFFACGNGKSVEFETDESFKVHPSAILHDDLRVGEYYDARKELIGWSLPEFDDSDWANAIKAEIPLGECREGKHRLVKEIREIKPISIKKGKMRICDNVRSNLPIPELPDDEKVNEGYIYDFGENTSGIIRLKIKGKKGQKIVIHCGESLWNGEIDMLNIGEFQPQYMTQRDVYICKGDGEEIWKPMFTFHGFQYCLVTGIDEEQATEDLLTYIVIHADIHQTGGFICSDEIVNRLQNATLRSNFANILYFPTDCPHREKNGWTGDAHLSAEQFIFNIDADDTLREWLFSVRKAQNKDGALPGIVPTGGWGFEWGNGPAWDAVLAEIPYVLWKYRGNTDIITENADAIDKYLHYVSSKTDKNGLLHIGLGDWLPVGNEVVTPLEVTDTLVTKGIADKAAQMFRAIGMDEKAEYAEKLSSDLRKSFREHLINEDLEVFGNTQTSQATALYYGAFDENEKEKAFSILLNLIHNAGDSMTVGIIGARTIFHVLSEFGYDELALHMIAKPDYPSFGSWITEYNANTLFEIITHDPPNGYSHNHHFFGDISAWFIRNLSGIIPNYNCNDSSSIVISPAFVSSLSFAEGWYTTPSGKVISKWERLKGKLILTTTVPNGLKGKIVLRNGYSFENGKKEIPIQSGKFIIISE